MFNRMNIFEKTKIIKEKALEIGFDDVGIIKADFLSDQKNYLQDWLNKGFHAEMSYMQNNFEKRLDSRLLVENAKSIIIVLKNYFPSKIQIPDTYKVSKYAYGQDYHKVLKDDLFSLFEYINTNISQISGRVFVDSAPVLEKALAQKAGLGWIGKNSLLLTKKGSFMFIGEIIIDLELEYDSPNIKNFCGNCTKCINACPTNAITEPYIIDSSKCISYLTIEKKGEFSNEENYNFNDYIFGCDICQDVCPWNNKSVKTTDSRFEPNNLLLSLTKKDWNEISEQTFNNIFADTAVKRTKYSGLKRNIEFVDKKKYRT